MKVLLIVILILLGLVSGSLLSFLSRAPEEAFQVLYQKLKMQNPDMNVTWEEFIDSCMRIYWFLWIVIVIILIIIFLIIKF